MTEVEGKSEAEAKGEAEGETEIEGEAETSAENVIAIESEEDETENNTNGDDALSTGTVFISSINIFFIIWNEKRIVLLLYKYIVYINEIRVNI